MLLWCVVRVCAGLFLMGLSTWVVFAAEGDVAFIAAVGFLWAALLIVGYSDLLEWLDSEDVE
jgi:hypothetical protein